MKLLLLPGLGSSPELFEPLIDATPDGFECTVVTYPTDVDLNYPGYAEHVLEQHLPRSPFLFVGESFSGPVAILAATQKPAGLAGIVLCNSFAVRPAWRGWKHLPWGLLMNIPVTRTAAGFLMVGFENAKDFLGSIRRAHRAVEPAVLASRLRLTLDVDLRRELESLETPVLYLRGIDDRLVGLASLEQVVRSRPSTQVVRMAGPHLLLQVAPEASWRAIEEFVEENPVAAVR